MLVAVEAANGPGSDDHSPSPSQLLRDLDSCNSDPVAVASCFVERVRRATSLLLVLLFWGLSGIGTPTFRGHLSPGAPLQGKCQIPYLEWVGCSVDTWGKGGRGALGGQGYVFGLSGFTGKWKSP